MKLSESHNQEVLSTSISPQIEQSLIKMMAFRMQMGKRLDLEVVERFWGSEARRYLEQMDSNIVNELVISKDHSLLDKRREVTAKLEQLFMGKWYMRWGVQFVGISGSLAAGTYESWHDIDLFIVTRNHHAWIYRGLMKLFGRKYVRNYSEGREAGKLCTNFLCEERATRFNREDIFILHELLYMIPVYNVGYLDAIFARNSWLGEKYAIPSRLLGSESDDQSANIAVKGLNYIAYLMQVVYMRLSRHKPNFARIRAGYSEGRIEFYPEKFYGEVMKGYKECLKKVKDQLTGQVGQRFNK